MPDRPDRFILIILDGLGLRDTRENNAFRLARTPTFNRLFKESPWSTLDASQEAVGLPAGVIGNSEVGHMTIGAGRILKNDLVRINDSIADGTFKDKGEIKNIGGRRSDFVKVDFVFRKNWSGETKTLTTFVKGSYNTFDTGIVSDASLLPGAVGKFDLYVPHDFGGFIGYSYIIDWEEYQ